MSLTEGRASSPCLNCVGWQDTSLTVVRKIERPPLVLTVLGGRTRAHLNNSSQASSPYLNCVGWQDKPTVELPMVLQVALSGCRNLDTATIWPVHHFDVGGQISLFCIWDITPFWCCQTCLVVVLLCHCRLVDRIEENNKMVIVGLRLVSSQTRLLPTMTLYCTIILDYCRVQLKKKKNIK